ncbi:DUF2442 domain-containing protein [Sphingomonas sp. 35-24ZXX]|uniref:DUF2442 domain-containing protein n=1 Tax=Sphingomonas sp. 35-24ZXX TaxID=1545915 RepID=UPI000692425D|nr:DUF2442 domain-containing protein [Sphingomonas sp. 35-24ZXX]
MIKLSSCKPVGDLRLSLSFSDGTTGIWDAADLLGSKDTPLIMPLRDPNAFAKAFIDNGPLAWPNGLELAPWTLGGRSAQASGGLRTLRKDTNRGEACHASRLAP